MKNGIKCIMLVDDNADDNFYHERVIKKSAAADIVIAKQTAMDALEYLKSNNKNSSAYPDLILLDINMPGMNGWEFLQEYNKLDQQFAQAIVIMLTTSGNPDDKIKAKSFLNVSDFKTKPLSKEMLEEISEKYFSH